MRSVNAREPNQAFSRILGEGDEVVITRRGRPTATLGPYREPAHTPEREAAVQHALALLRDAKPTWRARRFTRDEMHER